MNLVIDIGNSSIKTAIFEKGEMIASSQFEDEGLIPGWFSGFPGIRRAIISTVRKDDGGLKQTLEAGGTEVLILDMNTRLPLANRYRTPETLGKDRLAAAVGASVTFPGHNILVIDAGTAITIDLVSAGNEYLGGNISPGLSMRFKSLEKFTDNLPLVRRAETDTLLGDDTESAIRSGVQWGIIFELDEYINRQKKRYSDLKVIMTGGDAPFFDKKLKNSIFVDLNLNLRGLDRIIDYNLDA